MARYTAEEDLSMFQVGFDSGGEVDIAEGPAFTLPYSEDEEQDVSSSFLFTITFIIISPKFPIISKFLITITISSIPIS